MKLQSMTGYGKARMTIKKFGVLEVEISSFNRRQLDIRVVLPESICAFEAEIVKVLQSKISRGSVNCVLRIARPASSSKPTLNHEVVKNYLKLARKLESESSVKNDLSVTTLLGFPDVILYQDKEELPANILAEIKKVVNMAVADMALMKKREGAFIGRDILRKINEMERKLFKIEELAPMVKKRYSDSLKERIKAEGIKVDDLDERFAKELVIFADRCDISEEITRIKSHLNQFCIFIKTSSEAGRSLDFLCQELMREINTLGSKANSAEIAKHVIDFKTTLEKVREQVQNVE